MTASVEPSPLLRVRGVHKSYGHLEVLRGIDLDVAEREVVVLLGPSGSGKSTLLRCVQQLEPIQGGAIFIGDELLGYEWHGGHLRPLKERDVRRQRHEVGTVFQQFNLFPHLSVLENLIEGPTRVRGVPRAAAIDTARGLLERVGLTDKVDAYPRHLSGGQQQRVAIARALAMEPKLVLFDEPTSALDPELVGEVLAVMKDLAQGGLTMVVVTHELSFARDVADRCVFMEDGLVVEAGPASILDDPQSARLRTFLSHFLDQSNQPNQAKEPTP